MKVKVPSPLRSYTRQQSLIQAAGATVADVVADINQQFPGLRFRIIDEQDRIREHIRIFLDEEPVRDLQTPTGGAGILHIICALSGGV